MKEVTLYDILGVLAPGTVFTVGMLTLYPDVAPIITRKEFTVGNFGLVILVSYISGNLVAALGHCLERLWWKVRCGSPTDRARKPGGSILTTREQEGVQRKLVQASIIGANEAIAGLATDDWRSVTRRIYTDLERRGVTRRIDLFNAQYGMNRGIAAALIVVICAIPIQFGFGYWRLQLVLSAGAALALHRMARFSRYYASELFRQFLVDSTPGPQTTER
jgi:hypothetical protein